VNEYDQAILGAGGAQGDEYSQAVLGQQAQDGISSRLGYLVGSQQDPDAYAEARRVAASTGVPVDTVLARPADMKHQAAMGLIDFDALVATAPATAALLADVQKASVAHDDVGSLQAVEGTLGALGKKDLDRPKALQALVDAGGFAGGTLSALASALPKFNEGAWGALRAAGDILPSAIGQPIADFAARMGQTQRALADKLMPKAEGLLGASWYSGMQSFGLNALNLPLAFIPGGQEAVAARIGTSLTPLATAVAEQVAPRMAPVLWSMGATTGGMAYGEARDRGVGVLPSLAFGASQGVIEAGTEMIGMPALFSLLKPGKFAAKAAEYMLKEQGGEQLATHLQDLNEWATLHPERPFTDYLAERPAAAVQTALSVVFAGAAQAGTARGVGHVLYKAHQDSEKALASQQQAALLGQLTQIAQADKLLAREPETFQDFVQQAAEDGPVEQVYIDGNTLMQSGLVPQLAELSPAIAAQADEAAKTGGLVAIPVGEYAARIAPSEHAAALLEHLKTDPEGFSRAEAQVYLQTQGEQLQQEMVRALTDSVRAEQILADVASVREILKDELVNAGRRPDVADAESAVLGAYYATRAQDLDLKASELFEQRRLRIGAEPLDGEVLGQALATQPPEDWVHSTSGQDAAALFNGQTQARAVFWTDLQGKLAQDAPDLAGYSHSLDRSRADHIRKQHGDAGTETARGQVAVTGDDLARIPEIVTSYDAIDTDVPIKNEQGGQTLRGVVFAKKYEDAVVVYTAVQNRKRQDLRGATLWKYPPTTDAQTALKRATSGLTSETLGGMDASVSQGGGLHQGARGAFSPEHLAITLLKGADLSTTLHEAGHFFFENDVALASEIVARQTGEPTEGEQRILRDVGTVLTWHGLKGDVREQLAEWHNLPFEEKRSHHERFAESFERYLFEGRAPSLELTGYFQRFRTWMAGVYRSIKEFLARNPRAGALNPEVRAVFDRMLASDDQIALAEQGRSLVPLFEDAEQAGMTPEEFAAYQASGQQATADAVDELQARGLRDMQWLRNARGRELKRLQDEAKGLRAEHELEARVEVFSDPLYRAWRFLTNKLTEEDKLPEPVRTSTGQTLNPAQDSLLVAIAKLGGITRESAATHLGVHADDFRAPSGVFGAPVFRKTGGLSADAMAERLVEHGYLMPDASGAVDLHQLEDKVASELHGEPQYSFARDLGGMGQTEPRAGEGVDVATLGAARLDEGELKLMGLQPEVLASLKARRMVARNGLHPDLVAEQFGFTSGDELVRKLAAAETPREMVEALTDVRMLEAHGELATPEAIERAADEAVFNRARLRMVAAEDAALARATGKPRVLESAAREYAAALIARQRVRDLRPSRYTQAQTRAAREADKARKAGDVARAAAEKRNQLLQALAAREALQAREDVQRMVQYLRKFDRKVAGLDVGYADQIEQLLERFELRERSLKAIDQRVAFSKWLDEQREAGFEPDVPDALVSEANRQNYKNLTVQDLRALYETVRQIEHLGRLKNRLLLAQDAREYAAIRDEIAQSINQHAGNRHADNRTPSTNWGKAGKWLKAQGAAHIKVASWARIMDGGQDGGPVWEHFVRRANERGDMETGMRAEATQKLAAIIAPVRKLGAMSGKGAFFPSLGISLNRQERLALALNTGNEGNLQRLLDGEGWTREQIQPVLDSLTSVEWHAVQALWDHFDSYRPLIAAKEIRVYGKEPAWVQPAASSIIAADGIHVLLRGGYYPIKYDPARSQRAEEHVDAEAAKRELRGAYTSATTRRSFTKTRADQVKGRPLLLTLDGVYGGVNDVIHDLAWHEWLIDTNRLLRSQTIDEAIRSHYGAEVKQQFKTWAQDIAEGDRGAQAAMDAALGRLRQGVSVSGLGFNAVGAIMQPLGLSQSVVRVGAPWIGKAVLRYVASPVRLSREANEMSTFMANRTRTRFRELNELRNQVQDQGAFKEHVGRYAYWLMMRFQQVADVPTWHGAYDKALASGETEERSRALADQAVIDSQGGGETKDLAAIERGGPVQRLFTVFYSFMNTALNVGVVQAKTADTPARRAKLAADMLLLYTVPAVLGALLKDAITPGDDGDDDEKLVRKLIAEQISFLLGLFVVGREFAEIGKIAAGADGVRDYTGPAGLRVVADAIKFSQQARQGEFDDAFRKALVNAAGSTMGLPAAQINRSITGAKALAEGETENPAALVLGYQKPR